MIHEVPDKDYIIGLRGQNVEDFSVYKIKDVSTASPTVQIMCMTEPLKNVRKWQVPNEDEETLSKGFDLLLKDGTEWYA